MIGNTDGLRFDTIEYDWIPASGNVGMAWAPVSCRCAVGGFISRGSFDQADPVRRQIVSVVEAS